MFRTILHNVQVIPPKRGRIYLESIIRANDDHWRVHGDPEEDDGSILVPEPATKFLESTAGPPKLEKLPAAQQRDAERT